AGRICRRGARPFRGRPGAAGGATGVVVMAHARGRAAARRRRGRDRAHDSPHSRAGEAPRGADRWHRGAVAGPGPRAPALPPRAHALAIGLAWVQAVGVEADIVLDVQFPVAVIAILLRVPVGLDVALLQGV